MGKTKEEKKSKAASEQMGMEQEAMASKSQTSPGAVKVPGNEECDCCPDAPGCEWTDNPESTQRYTYFEKLDPFYPFVFNTKTNISKLGENEMRITFMGSVIPMNMRKTQQEMSIFVEVGWDEETQTPMDQFIFDCGSGVSTNYNAMNVNLGRMNKVFINHLHGDHMSDLTHMYCFGPSQGRTSPLYVFGPTRSGITTPDYMGTPGQDYDDGTRAFCQNLRKACRWHTESFSFQTTMYDGYPTQEDIQSAWGLKELPVPVEDDPWGDSYAMVPVELDWKKGGTAYDNADTGVKITYFPVIHARKGSLGYKLEWKTPRGEILSMIYTSDTKPEYNCVRQAINQRKGVDVFIHEMIVPAQIWTMKMAHMNKLPDLDSAGVKWMAMVQNSSHSPQGGFGYLLSLIKPRPRLTVATHFPVADDTVACAMKSIREHCDVHQGKQHPGYGKNAARITWSTDLMVIKVTKEEIVELRGEINDYEFGATVVVPNKTPIPAKYHDAEDNSGDPFAQIDRSTEIPSCYTEGNHCKCNYRPDGY
ncbi:MBL fold metallo-hydrolase [Chlorobium phaeobacteroides]|uniref:Metal-dependent hydrolases of the beta-lactamase superfamily III-like protein n=1 Tax=Chlorobium phaeobacteroides (strain DSM 266 / SMG 266 / 2430) TaxID=290317 RepID=A1BIB4_CHLPD|nr:MBL fold metallo-hydrolase [Chlorobium phaeobacteroides]ABL66141.1 Metal-dependent hydrolases of the beta-lactamase superfamily III-like protein [Chlorobium phaeobacteroides DSM 266]